MNNPQYQKVLTNKVNIVGALKATEGATGNLTTEFHAKSWIPHTANPTAERLVTTALGRIKLAPAEFDIFIDMLKAVPGLGPIVKILEGSPSPTDRTSRQSTDKASRQSSPYTQGRVDLGTVISINQLDKIARDLLIRWEDLSPSLRLTQQQEQDIRATYRVYGDQKREALRVWKQNKGEGATFGALIDAAKDVFYMQLAHDIRNLMKTLRVETDQSQPEEQYDDEPDSRDEKKKPKTKPHQAGQLKSDSGPHSLTEEPDIRRRKKKVTMETPPEDDEKSDTHTPPPAEGNGGQNTKGSDSGTKNNNEPTVDLTAGVLGTGITIKNVLKGPSAVVLVILILLVTLAVAIFFIVRELKK